VTDLLYVRIDTTSNAILTQGITSKDFYQGIVHQPKNLLLLNPSSGLGEFEPHTAMRVIRGEAATNHYFQLMNKSVHSEDNKWIDFNDLAMLKELSPLEISELLYLGHMKTHLHSPFFYKLQNNFVFFDLNDFIARTYYRYLDEFYRILSSKLTQLTLTALNEKRSFFKKPKPVERLSLETMRALRDVMREGIAFSMKHATQSEGNFRIPMYIIGDTRFHLSADSLKKDQWVGELIYSTQSKKWTLNLDEEQLSLTSLTVNF
jgi:hypothetical protein